MKPQYCTNILCVQNHNLAGQLNGFFAENPNAIYGAFIDRKVAQTICDGCCEDAEVVEYVEKN